MKLYLLLSKESEEYSPANDDQKKNTFENIQFFALRCFIFLFLLLLIHGLMIGVSLQKPS